MAASAAWEHAAAVDERTDQSTVVVTELAVSMDPASAVDCSFVTASK